VVLQHSNGIKTWSSSETPCASSSQRQLLSHGNRAVTCLDGEEQMVAPDCALALTSAKPPGLLQLMQTSSRRAVWLAARYVGEESYSVCLGTSGGLNFTGQSGSRLLWSSAPAAIAEAGPFNALIRDSALQVGVED
jgi:hypothetical protein